MLPTNIKIGYNPSPNEYRYGDKLAAFYRASVYQRLPAALWRYPGREMPQALVDLSGAARPANIDFTRSRPGFAFAPFVNEGSQETLFLTAGLLLDQTGLPFQPDHPGRNGHHAAAKSRFLETFQELAVTRQTDQ